MPVLGKVDADRCKEVVFRGKVDAKEVWNFEMLKLFFETLHNQGHPIEESFKNSYQ